METTAYETSIHVFKHGKCFEVTLPSQLATFYGYYPFFTIDCMLSNREFKMPRRRRQRERQNSNSLFNGLLCIFSLFVHFSAVTARLRRENA